MASTSQVTLESDLSREKVEHAFKLLEVSSRMLRVLLQQIEQYTDLFVLQEGLGRKGVQTPNETELNALKERVKTLSSEKTALEGKLKMLSQSKKGQSSTFDMHFDQQICLVFTRFSFYRVRSLCQIFRDSGKLGTGFKDSYVPKCR